MPDSNSFGIDSAIAQVKGASYGRVTGGKAVWTSHTMARKPGKKYTAAAGQIEKRPYTLEDAIPSVQKIKFSKFDETVEVHMRLGVDPK
ncbi:hypothetical protein OY671_012227, partial [Metschnikowia pulcherrima]